MKIIIIISELSQFLEIRDMKMEIIIMIEKELYLIEILEIILE